LERCAAGEDEKGKGKTRGETRPVAYHRPRRLIPTETCNVPAVCILWWISQEICRSSKERYCRLQATQTPAGGAIDGITFCLEGVVA
jgi:hypothetical protein